MYRSTNKSNILTKEIILRTNHFPVFRHGLQHRVSGFNRALMLNFLSPFLYTFTLSTCLSRPNVLFQRSGRIYAIWFKLFLFVSEMYVSLFAWVNVCLPITFIMSKINLPSVVHCLFVFFVTYSTHAFTFASFEHRKDREQTWRNHERGIYGRFVRKQSAFCFYIHSQTHVYKDVSHPPSPCFSFAYSHSPFIYARGSHALQYLPSVCITNISAVCCRFLFIY